MRVLDDRDRRRALDEGAADGAGQDQAVVAAERRQVDGTRGVEQLAQRLQRNRHRQRLAGAAEK